MDQDDGGLQQPPSAVEPFERRDGDMTPAEGRPLGDEAPETQLAQSSSGVEKEQPVDLSIKTTELATSEETQASDVREKEEESQPLDGAAIAWADTGDRSATHESMVADVGPLDDDTELHLEPDKPPAVKATGVLRRDQLPNSATPVDISAHKMLKYSLYETSTRYYLVGGDIGDENFRVLKIDRTAPPGHLGIVEDEVVYDRHQMSSLLTTIDQGNKASGGMKLRRNTWGLLGFIRFTEAYYMVIVTKKQQVAMIGGHYIYQVDGTELVPLTTGPASKSLSNKGGEEQRYHSIFHILDLHRSFYFSYSYGITRTLQDNIYHLRNDSKSNPHDRLNKMFVWNHHLLEPALEHLKKPYDWCLPVIHGFVDQSSLDVFGKSIWITLIGRRSRFFAGARFLKRGVNDLGYVANDVETEQIVAEMDTTSLDAPSRRVLKNPNYTSFVQHRGSIPLYWTQENSTLTPKPAIELNLIDPFYSAAALHFDNLFERYGAPVIVLNLVKSRERIPRETKLLVEYENAISYLNQSLPADKKIGYVSFDMSRAAKARGAEVITRLEEIAEEVVHRTGFFHNGVAQNGETCIQNGTTRSNCIDCLDRTNACQFVIGKSAFALQLQALGLIAGDHLNYDSDASNLLANMYNDHGDTLASQYGGSHLVNTTDSYRKINNWQSHSRDMLESFKRYYHNSFLDSQRQEAYNLFLGNYRYAHGQPMLWELPNDYYLHHAAPTAFGKRVRRDYINWFTPEFLEPRIMSPLHDKARRPRVGGDTYASDWWKEYYKPGTYTSFAKHFAYRVNSSSRYLPKHLPQNHDRSPFVVRKSLNDPDNSNQNGKQSLYADSEHGSSSAINPLSATAPPQALPKRISSLQEWLQELPDPSQSESEESRHGLQPLNMNSPFMPADKKLMHQWTTQQWYDNCMNPTVNTEQKQEYDSYLKLEGLIYHPKDGPVPGAAIYYEDYVTKMDQIGALPLGEGCMASAAAYDKWLYGQPEEPFTITKEDLESKRYKVYDKWLRGKDIFKKSKTDPETTYGTRAPIESFSQG